VPQLLSEDVQTIDAVLREFLTKSEASSVIVAAEGGFPVFHHGDPTLFDCQTLAALAANAFSATQAIAKGMNESSFSSLYQQGQNYSMLVSDIDNYNLLITVFPARVSAGAVKYFASSAIQTIARQFNKAKLRAPEQAPIDFALLNLSDTVEFFKRKLA